MISKLIKKILIFALIFIAWQLTCSAHTVSTFLLPTPYMVFNALKNMINNGDMVKAITISMRRVCIGFGLAFICSFILVIISVIFEGIDEYYNSLLNAIRHIPPISIIPLLILWTGIGEMPKIIIIFLASFFSMLLNTDVGIRGCDNNLVEVGKSFGMCKLEILIKIMIPNGLPSIFVGVRLAIGYSIRALVGAEMVAATSGVGYYILDAQSMSRTDKVIAMIIVISIIGLVVDKILGIITSKLFIYDKV